MLDRARQVDGDEEEEEVPSERDMSELEDPRLEEWQEEESEDPESERLHGQRCDTSSSRAASTMSDSPRAVLFYGGIEPALSEARTLPPPRRGNCKFCQERDVYTETSARCDGINWDEYMRHPRSFQTCSACLWSNKSAIVDEIALREYPSISVPDLATLRDHGRFFTVAPTARAFGTARTVIRYWREDLRDWCKVGAPSYVLTLHAERLQKGEMRIECINLVGDTVLSRTYPFCGHVLEKSGQCRGRVSIGDLRADLVRQLRIAPSSLCLISNDGQILNENYDHQSPLCSQKMEDLSAHSAPLESSSSQQCTLPTAVRKLVEELREPVGRSAAHLSGRPGCVPMASRCHVSAELLGAPSNKTFARRLAGSSSLQDQSSAIACGGHDAASQNVAWASTALSKTAEATLPGSLKGTDVVPSLVSLMGKEPLPALGGAGVASETFDAAVAERSPRPDTTRMVPGPEDIGMMATDRVEGPHCADSNMGQVRALHVPAPEALANLDVNATMCVRRAHREPLRRRRRGAYKLLHGVRRVSKRAAGIMRKPQLLSEFHRLYGRQPNSANLVWMRRMISE